MSETWLNITHGYIRIKEFTKKHIFSFLTPLILSYSTHVAVYALVA